jgi:hypothetical protein
VQCNVAVGLSLLEGKRQETQNLWYEHQLHWLSHVQFMSHICKTYIIFAENKVNQPVV